MVGVDEPARDRRDKEKGRDEGSPCSVSIEEVERHLIADEENAIGKEPGADHEKDTSQLAVARHAGLSPAQVVEIHGAGTYLVYMLGFTPGFPYLGGMSRRIAAPRLDSPRTRIPAGSVGIAGEQTGIYPVESPGGWRIIGRTPLRLFDPAAPRPFLLAAGDVLRFSAVDREEYEAIARRVEAGDDQVDAAPRSGGEGT